MDISLNGYQIHIRIIYKNNKNIYFRFDENLVLVVTCPKRTSDDEIFKLIEDNSSAILKMYEKSLERKKYDSEFWLLGKKYHVVFDPLKNDVVIEDDILYVKDDEKLEYYLENLIVKTFTDEAKICEKCFNKLPEYTIKYRKMKTRWGVCNRRNNTITLNTELIKKDVELLDYVIIHEMAHFYEGNHSKAFWNIVKAACPSYEERRKRLRK